MGCRHVRGAGLRASSGPILCQVRVTARDVLASGVQLTGCRYVQVPRIGPYLIAALKNALPRASLTLRAES